MHCLAILQHYKITAGDYILPGTLIDNNLENRSLHRPFIWSWYVDKLRTHGKAIDTRLTILLTEGWKMSWQIDMVSWLLPIAIGVFCTRHKSSFRIKPNLNPLHLHRRCKTHCQVLESMRLSVNLLYYMKKRYLCNDNCHSPSTVSCASIDNETFAWRKRNIHMYS